MKRELGYRIKDNGTWYYGAPTRAVKETDKTCAFNGADDRNEPYFNLFADIETLGQYTGLKDKNGDKIYEGDIVRIQDFYKLGNFTDEKKKKEHKKYLIKECGVIFDDDDNYHVDYLYKVEWLMNGFYPFADSPENCHHCGGAINNAECVIIGNIYDNPELLKKK